MIFDVLNDLEKVLFPTYKFCIAGGAVRDFLMGKTPKDYDVFILDVPEQDHKETAQKLIQQIANFPNLKSIKPIVEWHKSEPFLVKSFILDPSACEVQIMTTPCKTQEELIDTFDWNVCLFSVSKQNGRIKYINKEDVSNIGIGAELKLNKLTFPTSTLRRGFRFSERLLMKFPKETLLTICKTIVESSITTALVKE